MTRPLSAVVLVAALLPVVLASPAHAADEFGLSRDGETWQSSLDAPLFDEGQRWVPGDSESARFFIRNQGGTRARLTVDVVVPRPAGLMDSSDLRIAATGGGGTWTSVDRSGTHRLLSTPDIADGAVVPVAVTVSFDAGSTNVTQLRRTSFRLRVTLSESGWELAGADDHYGMLPDTGAPSTWIAGLGGLLVGTGLAVVARRRHREELSPDA